MMVPHVFDIRQRMRAYTDQYGIRRGGFETLTDAKTEAAHRVRLLAAGPPEQRFVAERVGDCSKRDRCKSPACPVCARLFRTQWCARTLQLLSDYDTASLRMLTLVNPVDAIGKGGLQQFSPRRMIDRTRRQLARAGISPTSGFFIGGIDGDWDEGHQLFQPHLHAIVYGDFDAQLTAMVDRWQQIHRIRVRKRLELIKDLPRQLAYCRKTFWPCVARRNNPAGIPPHRNHRPPANIEREVLVWLDRYRFSDFGFLYGVRDQGSMSRSR